MDKPVNKLNIFGFSHIKILRTFYRILIIFSLVIISDYPPPDTPSKYHLLDSGSKRKNERGIDAAYSLFYKKVRSNISHGFT